MELHFFPGQNLLAIKNNGKYLFSYDAWGGPEKITVSTNNSPSAEPTTAGIYIIHSIKPYTTPTWSYSKIQWGTRLLDKPALNDVYYELPSKKWASVKNDIGADRKTLLKLYFDYYGKMKIPDTWVFNDFGPVAIRWFKDLNGNKVLDGKETLSGQMFHTTPQNEAESESGKPITGYLSHGCIHLKPKDRDAIMVLGGFRPKTTFVVHKYDEKI